jgi:hypothetical protein
MYWEKWLPRAIRNKRRGMLTSGVVCNAYSRCSALPWLHDAFMQLFTLDHSWSISAGSCLTTLLTAQILSEGLTHLPAWRTGWDQSSSTVMRSWLKVWRRGWARRRQISWHKRTEASLIHVPVSSHFSRLCSGGTVRWTVRLLGCV